MLWVCGVAILILWQRFLVSPFGLSCGSDVVEFTRSGRAICSTSEGFQFIEWRIRVFITKWWQRRGSCILTSYIIHRLGSLDVSWSHQSGVPIRDSHKIIGMRENHFLQLRWHNHNYWQFGNKHVYYSIIQVVFTHFCTHRFNIGSIWNE